MASEPEPRALRVWIYASDQTARVVLIPVGSKENL